MVLYGQIIIGAPGAGKTTYCDGMQQYLRLLGRECYVVNLDPANEVPATDDNNNADENNNGEPADNNASISDADNVESDNSKQDDNNVNTANSQLPYETILDVCQDIISLDAVMKELHLGPNGGLLYCMEYIEHHFGEVLKLLKERLGIADAKGLQHCRAYLLFDLPGQIELTAHSNVITKIAERLVRELDLRLVCVQLVDAAVCLTDVSKFIGASLVCTASMMRLELPCVNLLSKMDLLQDTTLSSNTDGADNKNESDDDDDSDFGYDDYDRSPMPFNLEFFTQCHDLHRLVDYLDSNPMEFMGGQQNDEEYMEDPEYIAAQQKTRTSNFSRKYRKLHQELCEVVEDFGLLSFLPLAIQDAESVGRVVARVDKCNGYVFVRENGGDAKMNQGDGVDNNDKMQDMFSSAMVADSEWATGVLSDVQEKYLGNVMFRENISELKQKDTRKNANVNDDDDDADDLPKLI